MLARWSERFPGRRRRRCLGRRPARRAVDLSDRVEAFGRAALESGAAGSTKVFVENWAQVFVGVEERALTRIHRLPCDLDLKVSPPTWRAGAPLEIAGGLGCSSDNPSANPRRAVLRLVRIDPSSGAYSKVPLESQLVAGGVIFAASVPSDLTTTFQDRGYRLPGVPAELAERLLGRPDPDRSLGGGLAPTAGRPSKPTAGRRTRPG